MSLKPASNCRMSFSCLSLPSPVRLIFRSWGTWSCWSYFSTLILRTFMRILKLFCLLISVESVVESGISVMEHHASQRRTLGEMLLHEGMLIAVNGSLLVHCDSIVKVIEIPLICITYIIFCFRKLSKTALLRERTPRKDLATLSGDQKTLS